MPRPRRTRATPGKSAGKSVETLRHEEDTRTNIPTAEYQSMVKDEQEAPLRVAYQRRNRDLDPQLVWRGKDEQDLADLVVNVPPLYIQEKVHPKVLIEDLVASSQWLVASGEKLSTNHSSLSTQGSFADLFADFNGLPEGADRTAFYQHDGYWQNRMILGDSLQVMASLSEREGLQGKVQCIYIDPPYGIKFNSNFQWSTTSRDVRDGNREHITREPEQVKAFRDTWRDGIHSYLTYLRDRLTIARDLLSDSGSVFVQIGDENVHRVRAVMDEVFGDSNFVSQITFRKTSPLNSGYIARINDYVLWFAKNRESAKFRRLFEVKAYGGESMYSRVQLEDGIRRTMTKEEREGNEELPPGGRAFANDNTRSSGFTPSCFYPVEVYGFRYPPQHYSWKTHQDGMERLKKAHRLAPTVSLPYYVRLYDDFPVREIESHWSDTRGDMDKTFVVQTSSKVLERCILMTTDPGDLVLDPTCGSGTTAYVAEQWGRRWIIVDTSRVALALARARIMGARYSYYLLADSRDGQMKEAELSRRAPSEMPVYGNIRQGFVYQRVPHITLRAIANNAEIDVIWEEFQEKLEPLRNELSVASGEWSATGVVSGEWIVDSEGTGDSSVASGQWSVASEGTGDDPLSTSHSPLQEWEIPRERPDHWPLDTEPLLADYWTLRIARQKEIDASIAARADYEYLYDKPYEDRRKVRVAGPFTVESISPHRVLGVDENGDVIDGIAELKPGYGTGYDFGQVILDNLKRSGVQQAHKEDRINFTSLTPWPGRFVCAEGRYAWPVASGVVDSGEKGGELSTNHSSLSTTSLSTEKRAAIFVGPEFGTVSRPDLVEAAREAADGGFDVLIACAFNYDAHTTEFESLGRIPVLKARMNADLHMAGELKNTGNGNLFVIFGEPDVEVASEEWLVDSLGNRVAPYDIFKVVSGTDSLAEINGLNGADLRAYAVLSCRREVWDYLADAASRVVDSSQHRGRAGQANHGGVSSVSWHCARLPGGTGDLPGLVRKAGNDVERGFRKLVEQLRGDQQNAQRADALTIHLPLTTSHWTQVTVNGVDVFHPNTGEVRSDGPEGIACSFIDTDYNQESFFVRHAYFLGAGDPYKSLKTTLKAEIDEDAWATLHSATSRPFPKPETGRIAVKVINHLGDEVMKVMTVH